MLDKILKANPRTKLRPKDYNIFLVKEDDGLKVVLKVINDENVRARYKNPDHEYRFPINDFDVSLWLNELNLPDLINLKEEEYANVKPGLDYGPAADIAESIRRLTGDAVIAKVFENQRARSTKVLAVVVVSHQDYAMFENETNSIYLDHSRKSSIFITGRHEQKDTLNTQYEEHDLLSSEQSWDSVWGDIGNPKDFVRAASKIIWFVQDEPQQIDEETLNENSLTLVRDDLTSVIEGDEE